MHKVIITLVLMFLSISLLKTNVLFSQENPTGSELREQKFMEAQQYRMQKEKYWQNNPESRYYNYKGKDNSSPPERKTRNFDLNTQSTGYQPIFDKNSSPIVTEYDLKSLEERLTGGNNNVTNRNKTNPERVSRTISSQGVKNKDDLIEPMRIDDKDEISSNKVHDYSGEIVFKVQILAKSHGRANVNKLKNNYGLAESITEEHNNNMYRYLAGSFSNYSEAAKYAKYLQSNGIYDAFVVAYENGMRVPVRSVINR